MVDVWTILQPNLSLTTIIGAVLVLIGVVSFFSFGLRTFLIILGKPLEWLIPGERKLKGNWMSWLFILVGLFLVFGISAIQNMARIVWEFLQTTEGIVVAISVAVLVIGYFVVMGRKNGNGGGKATPQTGKFKLR